jgi:hypothetical protein
VTDVSANHRIDELLFDIAFASFTPEMMHTDAIRALVVDTLLPILDRVFDQYSDDDFILRIDSLEINVGNVTEAELPAALAESLKKAFEQTLQHGSASSPTARPIPRSRDDVQKLLTFLADGLMPWTPDVRAQAVHEQLLERILRQGVDTFLPALRTSPVRGVLLARLVRQFPVEQLWALLRQLAAQHADVLMARFDALQALLQEAALDRATATTAMHAAWESLLTIYMEPHASLPTFVALLKPAVAAIAAQRQQTNAEAAAILARAVVASRGHVAWDEIGRVLISLADPEAIGTARTLTAASPHFDVENDARSASIASGMSSFDTAPVAMVGGEQEYQRMSPRMDALLHTVAAQELASTATPEDAPDVPASLRKGNEPSQAERGRQSVTAQDDEGAVSARLRASLDTPRTTSDLPSLAQLFEAIRSNKEPFRHRTFDVTQLEAWVREAVHEPSFLQAIVAHAASARDVHAYYSQILQALAQNQIVDLEMFSATDDAIVIQTAPHSQVNEHLTDALELFESAKLSSASKTRQSSVAQPANAIAMPDANALDMRENPPLFARLVRALISGDPALLYDEWDGLLDKHARVLREAFQHYGMHDEILERIVQSFPESMLYDIAALLGPSAAPAWHLLRTPAEWALASHSTYGYGLRSSERNDGKYIIDKAIAVGNIVAGTQDDPSETIAPGVLASWKRQLWKAGLHHLLRLPNTLGNRDSTSSLAQQRSTTTHNSERDDDAAVAPVTPTPQGLIAMLANEAVLNRQTWQRRYLSNWLRLLEGRQTDTSADTVVRATRESGQATAVRPVIETAATAAGDSPTDDLKQILQLHRRLTAQGGTLSSRAHSMPEEALNDFQQRFVHIKRNLASIDDTLDSESLGHVIDAFIAVHSDASPQQRTIFMEAIVSHAPRTLLHSRAAYFRAVLQALLQDQALDLEAMAKTSIDAASEQRAVAKTATHDSPASQATTPEDTTLRVAAHPLGSDADQSNVREASENSVTADSRAHLDFLLAPEFGADGVAPPTGLVAWLEHAIDIADPELPAMLARLSSNPPSVARLLALLPASSWPRLAELAALAPRDVQRMRRYVDDIGDMFSEHHGRPANKELARLQWMFLLPHLFAAHPVFDPLRFADEWAQCLTRETGLPVPPELAAQIRRKIGINLDTPASAASRVSVPGATGTYHNAVKLNLSGNATKPVSVASLSIESTPMNETVWQQHEAISVPNAGAVLVWPFLPRMWEVLDLTRGQRFVDESAAQRAALLLQFIVYERTTAPEYQLTLNKLLCGVHSQTPMSREIEMTVEETSLVEQMLSALISHWKVLGNTSIRGLRETFLQRPGYVSLKEDGWHLHVQRGPFDMLMDKLPWSISTIRYPWMENPLWVQWNE